MSALQPKFNVGEIIHHRLFNYRGVIVDVDPGFRGVDRLTCDVDHARPPPGKPWYHIIVDETGQQTYVAERNLEPDPSGRPVNHPSLQDHFAGMKDGRYIIRLVN